MISDHVHESISAQDVMCDLCDYGEVASYHCDDCLMNLCDRCVEKFHCKIVGKNGHHSLNKGVASYKMEFELCPVDGEKMTIFCRDCSIRLCSVCEASSKRHASHNIVGLRNYVVQEKEKLLERLDELSSKTAGLSYYSSEIQRTALNIELKWVEYKDAMNQEFASLLETIVDRQRELVARMEQEVQKSLQDLRNLDTRYAEILSKTCELSDELISAVQSLSKTEFLQRHPDLKSSCDQTESQIHRLQSAADVFPTFLEIPFSLHQEKVHLDDCLQFGAFESVKVKAKDAYTLFSPTKSSGIPAIQDLFVIPTALPPSTTMQYLTEIFAGASKKQHQLRHGHCLLAESDCVMNAHDCQPVQGEAGYLVRVTPVLVCNTHRGREEQKLRPVTTMILTDSSYQTDRASPRRQQISQIPLYRLFKRAACERKDQKKQKPSPPSLVQQANAHFSRGDSRVLPMAERHKIYTLPSDAKCTARPLASDGVFRVETRFIADYSFEEGRVLEDQNLKFYDQLIS